jgi:Fe-S-cluster containining protein
MARFSGQLRDDTDAVYHLGGTVRRTASNVKRVVLTGVLRKKKLIEFEERAENIFPGFSPAMRCVFLRCSAANCEIQTRHESRKSLNYREIDGGR